MEWFDKLGAFPAVQFVVAVLIGAIGLVAIWRGAMAQRREDGRAPAGEATVPVSTLYLREMCETLKEIEKLLQVQLRTMEDFIRSQGRRR